MTDRAQNFTVKFETSPFDALDQLALLAVQNYNIGAEGKWFNEFRGGLYGFYSRLYGVDLHYADLHAWRPRLRLPVDVEYHLTSVFFHMDSAVECLTFALNALGWAVAPNEFRDITNPKQLRAVGPSDVCGDASQPGFATVFPRVQALWQSHTFVLTRTRDLHDVSKHRSAIFVGSRARSDPPDGFFESLGVSSDPTRRALLLPMAEIILKADPKKPALHQGSVPVEDQEFLEELVPAFADLVNRSGHAALDDARANIPLKESQFRTT